MIFGVFTVILFIFTFKAQSSCHPVLWWQQGRVPECWEINVDPSSPVELQVGDSYNFSARVKNFPSLLPKFEWESEEKDIATITTKDLNLDRAKLVGDSAGKTTISVTLDSQQVRSQGIDLNRDTQLPKVSIPVTVRPKLSVEPKSLAIRVGEEKQLRADFNQTPQDRIKSFFGTSTIEWTSADPDLVTVENGTVKALKVGETVITAQLSGYPDVTFDILTKIAKRPPKVTRVEIVSDRSNAIYPGQSVNLDVKVYGEGEYDRGVTWLSSNTNVAIVKDGDQLEAFQPGSVTLTAKSNQDPNQSDRTTIQITDPRELFKIEPRQLSILPGQATQIQAQFKGSEIDNSKVGWTSSNPGMISVDRRGILCAHRENQSAIVQGKLPAKTFGDHPLVKDRIEVRSDRAVSKNNGGGWKTLVGPGVILVTGVVIGIGVTVATGNPIAGAVAGVGAAAVVGGAIQPSDSSDAIVSQCRSQPEISQVVNQYPGEKRHG